MTVGQFPDRNPWILPTVPTNRLEHQNPAPTRHAGPTLRPVSYTHLDVYKRQGLVVDPVDELHLQCAVGRFRKGAIVAAAGAAHGAFHAQPIQHESIFFGGVVAASITVEDRPGWKCDIAGGHLDRSGDQWGAVVIGHSPSHDGREEQSITNAT